MGVKREDKIKKEERGMCGKMLDGFRGLGTASKALLISIATITVWRGFG